MNHLVFKILMLLLSFSGSRVIGQTITGYTARVEDLGDCRYRVKGSTTGESTNPLLTFSVSVRINWTLKGLYLGQSFPDSASDTKTGQELVIAEIDITRNYPTFDEWDILMTGKHFLYSLLKANTGENYTFSCQFFVDNDDSCTEVIAKAVGDTPCNHSPIVIDLARDGFDFSGPEGAVAFDLYATGEPIVIHWVRPGGNDAFLARDTNGNGVVDDGAELFGNGSPLILEGDRPAPNGFVALAQFDDPALGGNNDGQISIDDAIWLELRLWLDEDADGLCEPDEMFALHGFEIESLETIPRETNWWDEHLNWLRYLAWAEGEESHLMVDVFFREVK